MTQEITIKRDRSVDIVSQRGPHRVVVAGYSLSGTIPRNGYDGILSGNVVTKTVDYTIAAGDIGKTIQFNKATAITGSFNAVSTLGNPFAVLIKNIGAGTLTLDPNGTEQINGLTSLDILSGEGAIVYRDGGSLRALVIRDPVYADDNRLLRTDTVNGGAQQSGVTLDDNDNMSGLRSLLMVDAPSIDYSPAGNPFDTVAALLLQAETAAVDYTKRQFLHSIGFTSKNGSLTFTATTNGTTTLSSLSPSATTLVARGLAVGAFVSDNNSATVGLGDIPLDAYVTAINTGANTITLSAAATGSHSAVPMWATPTYLSDRVAQFVSVVGQDDSGTLWSQNIAFTLMATFPKVVGGHGIELDVGINNRDYDTLSPSVFGMSVTGYGDKRATGAYLVSGNKLFGEGSTVTGTLTNTSPTIGSLSPTVTTLVARGMRVGDSVSSTHISGTILSYSTGSNTITLSANASASGSETLTILGPLFNFGLTFVNNSVRTYTIWDASYSTTSYYLAGTHDYGIDMSGATINTAAMLFKNVHKLKWRNNADSSSLQMIGVDTSDELVLGTDATQIVLQKNAGVNNLIFVNGTGLLSGSTAGNTVRAIGFNTLSAAWDTTFWTMTAGNPPTFSLSTSVTRNGNTILDSAAIGVSVQAFDADLSALAALSSTGIAVRTASNTWAQRSLTAPAAGLTISNNDGVSGNPTFALANDLSALEALSSTGFAVRTTTDTWAQRSLTAPAAGLTISNNDGVSGNPTFALANDLAALEALSGTSTIYYRSATDTWTAVTIGSNLGFSAGTLGSSLGTAATKNTGTSGASVIPTFDGGGTFTAQVAVTLSGSLANPVYQQSTNGDANPGPYLYLDRASPSPANNDVLGLISFAGRDDAAALREYASISAQAIVVTAAGITGRLNLATSAGVEALLQGGMVVGSPTGGVKGVGTINAQAVYDDNVLLTCPALSAEFREKGTISLEMWDAMVPDKVTARHVRQKPIQIDTGETIDHLIPVDGGYMRVTKPKKQTLKVWTPIYDADGKTGIDAFEEEQFEEIVSDEKREARKHTVAKLFKDLVDSGFDPREPEVFFAKMRKDEALPGMPSQADWQHAGLSIGEMHNRLWLATEMLALAVETMHERMTQQTK